MPKPCPTHHRIAATVAAAYAGLALTSTAGAVDMREWGRKYNIASERFVVLTSFNNEAVLDKETQLVWHRSKGGAYVWSIRPALYLVEYGCRSYDPCVRRKSDDRRLGHR